MVFLNKLKPNFFRSINKYSFIFFAFILFSTPSLVHAGNFAIRVYDSSNGNGIGGAGVLLVADDRSSSNHGMSRGTDGNGFANFGDIQDGGYNVEVRASGYNGADVRIGGGDYIEVGLNPAAPPPPPPTPTPIYGCTDSRAQNYNPSATHNDGSCVFANGPQDIQYTISGNTSYYNVRNSGHTVLNWNVNVSRFRGPSTMHVRTIGHFSEVSGSAPTTEHGFAVPASGKLDYRNPPESGSFSFSFDTRHSNCGRVQIDGSFIDDRNGSDANLFLGMIVDYGVDCNGTITPTPTPAPTPTPTPTPIPLTPTPIPSCVANISPSNISSGNSANLSWASSNANSVSISHGIGIVSSSGSRTVSPLSSTTYVVSVSGPGGSSTCSATVTVNGVSPSAPTCTMSASPTNITSGGSSTLSWTSTNATGASINQSIGSVALNSSRSVSPSSTTTYTMTVTGAGGSATCNTTVTVGSGTSGPTCTMNASPSTVTVGNPSNLSWSTTNTTSVSINQGVGSVANSGTVAVVASGPSTTYTLTATGVGGNTTCNSTVNVISGGGSGGGGGGVGGMNAPNVVMFQNRPDERPFASQSFVYLSQIPYTGLVVNAKTIIFFVLLTLWSAYLAYVFLKKTGNPTLEKISEIISDKYNRSFLKEEKALSIGELIKEKDVFEPVFHLAKNENVILKVPKTIDFNGNNLPVEEETENSIFTDETLKKLETMAKERGVLISTDALDLLSVPSFIEKKEINDVLDSVVSMAKTMYPREDGWVILDKKRLESLLLSTSYIIVPVFTSWLSQADSYKIFNFLRLLRSRGLSVKSFLKKVAYYADSLYRCRIGEKSESKMFDASNVCTNWSNNDIQKVVGALVDGADETYESEDASVKLAIMKIMEVSEKSKKDKSYYNSETAS